MQTNDGPGVPRPIQAELRDIYSDDVPDVWDYVPDPSEPFAFHLVLEIGAKGHPGADVFKIRVCNPLAVALFCSEKPLRGYGMLILEQFDFSAVEEYVRMFIGHSSGET